MASKRPTTIAEYIQAAPRDAQPHLHELYAILRKAAPKAEETIKWGNPFFIEPRFLFAFSGHKAHCGFAPSAAALTAFRKELAGHPTTANFLQLPHDRPLPEALIRKIARYRVKIVRESDSETFW